MRRICSEGKNENARERDIEREIQNLYELCINIIKLVNVNVDFYYTPLYIIIFQHKCILSFTVY